MLKGSRVTTSWLDSRQFRELGMPDVLKHNITTTNSSLMKERQGKGKHGSFPRGKAGWGRGRGRGRSPVLTSDQEFVYSSRSQSGPDSESLEGFGFCLQQHLPSIPSGQISSSKFQDVPKGVDVKRERLELLERPDSRTSSHSQSSWGEGDREGSRKRRESSPPAKYTPTAKGKVVDDADRGEKGSDKKKATTRMLYVPRSKRKREEISEAPSVDAKGLKSVFDRLGPTKAQEKDIHQLETYGELAAKKSKPNDSIVLSPTISKSPGKEESPARPSSTGSEKESGKPGGGPDEDSKKEKTMRSSEGDERKDRSSKHGSEHDSSRHSKGKKSRKRSTSSIEKKRSKSDKKERRSCDREKEKTKQVVGESLVQNTWREVPTSLALAPNETSAFMDDPGTPPLPPEVPSLAQGQSTVPRYDEAQWLEYCRQITSHREQEHGKETSQTVGSDLNTPGPVVNGEQVPSQSEVPLPNEQVRGKRPKENARLGLKKIDSATASATLQVRLKKLTA